MSSDRENSLLKLAQVLMRQSLKSINMSMKNLRSHDASLLKLALIQNSGLTVLRLSYNNLGDVGLAALAYHVGSLRELDVGFNNIGDRGCIAFSSALTKKVTLKTLYLAGNEIGESGAVAIATAIRGGSSLKCLHMTGNKIKSTGVKAITKAIVETDTAVVDELHLGGTFMGSEGCLSISNMLLSNNSMRVLSLSNNDLVDKDIGLLAQSISRNSECPLEAIDLSFNSITCIGTEALMNAIWGSKTLKQLRLDNNRIKDRGAQLITVVLTSVELETLNIGFNKITYVGIKALMKTLSRNNSLRALTLSGISLDTAAAKTVAYMLAYNRKLEALFVDNCSVGFHAQRHISAGIISNKNINICSLTGFRIAPLVVSLGFPSELEKLTNEQILEFCREMWLRSEQQETSGEDNANLSNCDCLQSSGLINDQCSTSERSSGPVNPDKVVSAAKTFYSLSVAEDAQRFTFHSKSNKDDHLRFSSPIVPVDDMILECDNASSSDEIGGAALSPLPCDGNIVPVDQVDTDILSFLSFDDCNSSVPSLDDATVSTVASSIIASAPRLDPARVRRNSLWICRHFMKLIELAETPFQRDDLLWYHQYLLTPIDDTSYMKSNYESCKRYPYYHPIPPSHQQDDGPCSNATRQPENDQTNSSKSKSPDFLQSRPLHRAVTSNAICGMVKGTGLSDGSSEDVEDRVFLQKRRSLSDISLSHDVRSQWHESFPSTKRARNDKPRIDYYPRIKSKLEYMRAKGSSLHPNALVLMRQLKYVEDILCKNININDDAPVEADHDVTNTAADVEMILLDLL